MDLDSTTYGVAGTIEEGTQELQLKGVIGFNGRVPNGLILHPGDQHIIYPLGSTIVVKHLLQNTQAFLQKDGHNSTVSCIALSRSGKYLASGQTTHLGFNAQILIWNLETYEVIHRLNLHKGKVQSLCFSSNERYLASLGGRDDNKLVLWDVETGKPICGAPAASETANVVKFFNNSDDQLVTAGDYNLRVWTLDRDARKLRPTDCSLGQLKRSFTTVAIDKDDQYMYCGSKTGDVLKISLQSKLFKVSGPVKRPFSLGITSLLLTQNGNVIVGAGDGTIAVLSGETLKTLNKIQIDNGGITSLAMNAAATHFFIGTIHSSMYLCELKTLQYELRATCHSDPINDIAFPHGYSELFATASKNEIRIWSLQSRSELLRIKVANLECLCVTFSRDGKSILSGWDDGKIRAFKPQSGQPLFVINDAHRDGVTALAVTYDGTRIISGGMCGQVRAWQLHGTSSRMIASMKEHKARVNSLQLSADNTECVSASDDGSCIIWSLERFSRNTCLFAATKFKSVMYHPDQSQLLTTGSDRKLSYWDIVDGSPIRILDGSQDDTINTLDISKDGNAFVAAGGDKIVRVWGYDEGFCHFAGAGHSGAICKVNISPDQRTIVSVGAEGAIFMWDMPYIEAPVYENNIDEQQY